MDTMTTIVVACEAVSITFLLPILYEALFDLPRANRKNTSFALCAIFTLLGTACDMFAFITDGYSFGFLQEIANLASLFVMGLIATSFGYYIYYLIAEKTEISIWLIRPLLLINIASVFATIIGFYLGTVYTVIDYVYTPTGLYYLEIAMPSVSLVYVWCIVIHYRKALDRKATITISLYCMLPFIAFMVEFIEPLLVLSYAAVSLSIEFLFILLQSDRISDYKMRSNLLKEMSYKDSLTGLKNRRAFNDDIDKQTEGSLGLVYCDLNGLKQVNDERGHKAGDEYLIRFANMLASSFPNDAIYRISGDEFAVMVKADTDKFGMLTDSFTTLTAESGIASIGAAHGNANDISSLIKLAEKQMYKSKAEFYLTHVRYERH